MSNFFNYAEIDFTTTPLFLGEDGRNIARLDIETESTGFIQKLTDRHLSQFWQPHDITIADLPTFVSMDDRKKEFYLKNLKFQTLLDSVATRSVLETLLPLATQPALSKYFAVHGMFEDIHSDSYATIIKALKLPDEFDDIINNEFIINRGRGIIDIFETLHKCNAEYTLGMRTTDEMIEPLLLSLYALNVLENVLFKTSFVCSFALAEDGLMTSSAKIISLIARDEIIHYTATKFLLRSLYKEERFRVVLDSVEFQTTVKNLYTQAYDDDVKWIDYLYETDPKLYSVTKSELIDFSYQNTFKTFNEVCFNKDMAVLGVNGNLPLPWYNKYVNQSNIQVALNETDGTNYLIGLVGTDTEEDWEV